MTIKKFQGRTEEEATAKAWEELGAHTVIMNVKEIKPKGLMRYFKSSTYEVTAAVEESEPVSSPRLVDGAPPAAPGNINLKADEPISIPEPEPLKEVFATVENTWNSASAKAVQARTEERRRESAVENNLEEKLESLQSLLEEKLSPQPDPKQELPKEPPMDENFKFIKMIYGILLENEVEDVPGLGKSGIIRRYWITIES